MTTPATRQRPVLATRLRVRLVLFLASQAALLMLGAPPAAAQATAVPTPAETEDAAQAAVREAQDLLARATTEFDGPQQGRSIVLFDEIIEKLDGLRRQSALPPAGREILVQTYELQARAYFNLGLQEKAAQVFRALIALRPQHTLGKERVSPKVADFFASVKKTLVGYLAVASKPPGAKVSLNGEFLSVTDFFPLEVLAGEYAVEIAREGYQTETRSLSLAPRATETLDVTLTRTTATCVFITQPPGVEIWIDGELRGTTAGSPPAELHEDLRARGFDPAKSSDRTEVPLLTLGTHVIELRKRCYESIRQGLEIPEPRDYDIDPIRLEDSLASLRLTSEPPGARILLDGELRGVTPMALDNVCSGPHRLEVKHAAGKFIQDVVLARNEDLAIDCPIRATLAFLGVASGEGDAGLVLGEVEEKILQNVSKISRLNILRPTREHVQRLLDAEHASMRALLPGGGAEAETVRRLSDSLAASLEVQGFLVAQMTEERLQRVARLHLLAAGNSVPDTKEVVYAESAAYLGLLADVDRVIPQHRTWAGLVTVDARLPVGVPVLRVIPEGPAAQAGILPGEIVYSADGQQITLTEQLLALIAAKKPGERLTLHLQAAAGSRAVELTLGASPQEVPLNDPAILYNTLMMDLRQQIDGYPGTEAAALARLNLALCAMHFRDYVAAHEHLLKARVELPQRPGISQGTALYYLGLALERLNYPQDAAATYRAAAEAVSATILDNDGPSVADLVARRVAP